MSELRPLIYVIVIIGFMVILVRKKALRLPFFKKKSTAEGSHERTVQKVPAKELRYEVLAFGTYDKPNPKDFGARIEAQLECELTRLSNKQIAYHVDYISMGGMLVLFISYEV